MPVTVKEVVGSQGATVSLEDDTVEFHFVAWGSNLEGEVRDAVETFMGSIEGPFGASIPGGLGSDNLLFQGLSLSHKGNGVWTATASYALKVPRGATTGKQLFDHGVVFRNFEIGTQQVKTNVSKGTVSMSFVDGEIPPNWQGAIGVNGDRIAGTEVNVPIHTWSRTHYFDPALITDAYEIAITNLMATPVNDAPFKGHDTGEVLFLGGSGALRDNANFEITFRFASQPNLAEVTIGDKTFGQPGGPIIKEGWEYLDVEFSRKQEPKQLGLRPRFLHIHKLYDKGDFSVLGIGN
jgi:hypothetical protein